MKKIIASFLTLCLAISMTSCSYNSGFYNGGFYDSDNVDSETEEYESQAIDIETEMTTIDDAVASGEEYPIVQFGTYEQDNNKKNGPEPIDWIIVDSNDQYALMISKYCIDCKPYNEDDIGECNSWKDCSLNEWLNNEFIEEAFTSEEQYCLLYSNFLCDHTLADSGRSSARVQPNISITYDMWLYGSDYVKAEFTDYAKEIFEENHYDSPLQAYWTSDCSDKEGQGTIIDENGEVHGGTYYWQMSPSTESVLLSEYYGVRPYIMVSHVSSDD